MPISQNLLENYDTYSRQYLQIIKNIFDCNNCKEKCIDHTIWHNHKEYVVDNLTECPCFLDKQPSVIENREAGINKRISEKERGEIPIYERLSVGEALIISKDENNKVLVAENHDGKLEFRYIPSLSEKDPNK